MAQDPLDPLDPTIGRRRFLQVGAAGALLCTIGGERVPLGRRGDAAKADAAAARVARPRVAAAPADPVDALRFGTPQPQPGGRAVEYWIQATTVRWPIVPTARDGWHGAAVRGPSTFTATVFQAMQPGFAGPAGPAAIPGPTLHAEVGDTLVLHFRNGLRDLRQAVTMHPHGVRYTPDYDGVYLGDHTRAGGFVAPGEEVTYTWECVPESVGVWPAPS
jgi:FtsP/CotA-like multicopper oxidase with cupredoxin domain